MSRSAEQKIKLLVLYDVLQKNTDEDRHLSTDEVITLLAEKGIEVQAKALIRDVKTLIDWGFEVMYYKKKSYYFYIAERHFDIPELRILIDAVQSASFISEKRTTNFIDKIAAMAGDRKAELLKKNIVCYDTTKHTNTHVFYSIDTLEKAIEEKRKVSFLYFNYNTNKEKVYRKDKWRYTVNPLALIFTNDNYYLVCYNDRYKNLSNYRIDRMEDLKIEDSEITPVKEYENFNIHKHKKEAFCMFVGELCDVEIEADEDMLDEVMDKFGEGIKITHRENDVFRVTVKVQISPPFLGWITVFQGKVRIKSPEHVKAKMEEFVLHKFTC